MRKSGNREESLIGMIAFAFGGTLTLVLAIDTLRGTMRFGLVVIIFVFAGMLLLGYGLKLIASSSR